MYSDSRWLSGSWELFNAPAIQNAYHTSLYSVTICPVRIQMCSARHVCWGQNGIWQTQLGAVSEPWYNRYVYRAQANKQGLRSTRNNSDRHIRRAAQTGRKTTKTPRRVSKWEGTTSSSWANRQTWLHFSICACHPNILPSLSQDGHMTQQVTVVGVNVVVTGCSSQQILTTHHSGFVSGTTGCIHPLFFAPVLSLLSTWHLSQKHDSIVLMVQYIVVRIAQFLVIFAQFLQIWIIQFQLLVRSWHDRWELPAISNCENLLVLNMFCI